MNQNIKEIKIPKNVNVSLKDNNILLTGLHGNSQININPNINIKINSNFIYLSSINNKKENKKFIGLYNSLIKKNLKGLSQNYKINLFLNGIGFKVKQVENKLIFKLGYSHDIEVDIPENINVSILRSTQLIFYGANWAELTQYVHNIKKLRKVEPYKGKGILLKNETVLRKEGKKNKK